MSRDEARKLIASGVDPAVNRKAEKIARADTFSAIAKEWLDLQRKKFSAATLTKAEWTFNDLLNPYIGSRPIRENHTTGTPWRYSEVRSAG